MKSTRYHNIYEDGATIFWTSSIVEWLPVLKSPKAAGYQLGLLVNFGGSKIEIVRLANSG